MHGYEAADRVVNFLRKSNGQFVNINFFDIASTTTRTTDKFANVPAAAIWQFSMVIISGYSLGRSETLKKFHSHVFP